MTTSVSPDDVRRAFRADGHAPDTSTTRAPGGGWGLVAHTTYSRCVSRQAYDTGGKRIVDDYKTHKTQARKLLYVTGTHADMGWLHGYLLADELELSCSTYLKHLVPTVLSEALDRKLHRANVLVRRYYDWLLQAVVSAVMNAVLQQYHRLKALRLVDPLLDEELAGIHQGWLARRQTDGARADDSIVSFSHLLALNWGADWLLASIVSGNIVRDVCPYLPGEWSTKCTLAATDFGLPDWCNGAALSGGALAAGQGPLLYRDFQLNNGRAYHRINTTIVRVPLSFKRRATASVGVAGLVGSVTVMNSGGLAGGVNVVRDPQAAPTWAGLSGLWLMRLCAEQATSTAEAQRIIDSSPRGCAWLYVWQDTQGDGRVVESLCGDAPASLQPGRVRQTNWCVSAREAKRLSAELWPEADEEARRWWTYVPGEEARGMYFRSLDEEHASLSTLRKQFVSPSRTESLEADAPVPGTRQRLTGVVAVTNSYHHTDLRPRLTVPKALTMELTALGEQWRYDVLLQCVRRYYGQWTTSLALEQLVALFSPLTGSPYALAARHMLTEGSRPPAGSAGDPHIASGRDTDVHGWIISGSITVVDCEQQHMWTKSGFWLCPAYRLSLRAYWSSETSA